MKVRDYAVIIPEGIEDNDGYVAMNHNTQYTIKLVNTGSRDSDVEVFIDDARVGEWRVNSSSSCIIERPSHDTGRFTFYRLDSIEARDIALKSSSDLGLIKVIFKPEVEEQRNYMGRPKSDLDAGGTGLSGTSSQRFKTVAPLETNPDEYVTIYLRLGAKKPEARPLSASSNPIPKPLNTKQ